MIGSSRGLVEMEMKGNEVIQVKKSELWNDNISKVQFISILSLPLKSLIVATLLNEY